MPRVRIHTVGYEKLQQADLQRLAVGLDCIVLDVCSRPSGRVKRGFSRADLTALLGARYEWAGHDLGGKSTGVTPAGLVRLAQDRRRLMLMCKEHSPSDCHRHAIALDLARRGVPVLHIFETEVILATDLEAAIDADDAYEFEDLADVLARTKAAK